MNTSDKSMIRKNELEANLFVAKATRVTAILLTLILILNITGIFVIETIPMIIAYVTGMIILLVPTILVNVLKLESPALKYIFVTIAALFVTIIIITMNWHAVVIFIFAIGIGSMYFSKKVNVYAVVLSILLFSGAQVVSYELNLTLDRNQLNYYSLFMYCIVPRAISLIGVSTIFLSLNARTTKLMSNLLDADAQLEIVNKMNLMRDKSIRVSDTLVDTVTTLSDVTENTNKNNKEISEKSSTAADGSSKTLAQLNEVAQNVSNISDNLSKLAKGTDEISVISKSVHNLTENNADNMNAAMMGFEKISESTNKSKEIINGLESKSQEIQQIVQVITSISGQTNLLALNASIESARAGEQGRGFAVVAEQIRQLAEQTKDAVGDISNIIGEVVANTLSAVESMEESSELVTNGMNIIKTAEESSKQVSAASEEMTGKIDEIDNVTRDVADYSEKIVCIVNEVKQISSTSLEELKEVTQASEAGLSDTEKLFELVSNIRNMSTQLDEVIHDA